MSASGDPGSLAGPAGSTSSNANSNSNDNGNGGSSGNGSGNSNGTSGSGTGTSRTTRHRLTEPLFSERLPAILDHRVSNFEGLERSLESASSELRSLLNLNESEASSMPQPLVPNPIPSSAHVHNHEHADEGRRAKRRKLGSERSVSHWPGFRYGRFGQIEPGQLTMEIVCCDGGIYTEGSPYTADNILKNDNSVYCTKGNRCNIVLRHQGATPFSLKELIIKAPGRNDYSAP